MSRKRIFFLYLGFVALLLVGTGIVLQETGVARNFVENLLAEFLDRDRFRLRDAAVDLGAGSVTLRGLEISTPTSDPGRAHLAFDSVVVGVDTNPLGEVGRVRSVQIRGMRMEIDLAEGRFPDLESVIRRPATGTGTPAAPPPPVEIVESSLRIRLDVDTPPIDFSDVSLKLLPDETTSGRVALSGSMRSPNGYLVQVEGSGDLGRREFRAQLRLADVPITPEVAKPYSARAVDFLAEIGVGGVARSITVWAEYPDSRSVGESGDQVVAGVRVELDDLKCSLPELPFPVAGATARVAADLRDNGTVTFLVDDASEFGDVHARGTIVGLLGDDPRAQLEVDAKDVVVGPVLGRAIAPLEEARSVWDAFGPTGGFVDGHVRIATATRTEPERVAVEIALRDVGARFVGFESREGSREFGFPFPITDLHGKVLIADGEVSLDGIGARLGPHDLTVAGQVLPGPNGTRVELDLRSPEIAFSPDVRSALQVLDPDFAAIYDEYAPEGAAALEVSIRSGDDRPGSGVHVRLRPLGASAAWRGFPCRVDQITGLVDIGTDGVSLGLEGSRGPTSIALAGRFPAARPSTGTDAEPTAVLRVTAKGMVIDDELRGAMRVLSGELGRTIEFLGVAGTLDLDLNTWRDHGADDFGYDVRVDMLDGSIELENLPLPTRGLHGPIFVNGQGGASHVEVGAVQGVVENGLGRPVATLLLQGAVTSDGARYETDLSAVVRGLELNDRLGHAMHEFGAFDASTWQLLAPAGLVDVVWRQTKEFAEAEPHQSLRIQLMDVRSDAAFLPAPAEHLFGDVRVDDGIARFRDVRATMAGADIRCASGSAAHTPDGTRFDAIVSSDDFPVDDRLAHLLDGPLKQTYLDREVRGRVRIHELRIGLQFPPSGPGFHSELSGRITALGLRLLLGAEIRDLAGAWTIDRAIVDADGGLVEGSVSSGGLSLFAHRATDVSARFRATTDEARFWNVVGRLHGGDVRGQTDDQADLVYTFGDPGTLQLDLAWNGISLAELARAAGVVDQRFRGNLSGKLRLDELVGTDIVNCKGAGSIAVTQGNLGQVPVFTAIYSYLAEPRRPKFEGLEMAFVIGDQRIRLDHLAVSSPLLTTTGSGSIDMDGYVDVRIDFPDFFGTSADWTFLPQMMRMLTNGLAQFQVYGYLRSPKTRPLWLWREAASRVPLGPIPPVRR